MQMREKLQKLVDEKYVRVQKHPTEELYIYNYTEKCQYDKFWTPETIMCRGLILDGEGNIVARPFNKFFNFGEHQEALPDGDFKVYDKLDGSLGILYWVNEDPYLATRGSFISEQAIKGTEILRCYKGKLDRDKTYLFEIIYPQNRIVVDYGMKEELYLLAVIDTKTGEEVDLSSVVSPFKKVKIYDGIKDIEELKKLENDTDEGFVVKWGNGFRLKLKFEEYVRLHRLITQTTARSIWELLKAQQSFTELLERVPDEFYGWVKMKVKFFNSKHEEIYKKCKAVVKRVCQEIEISNSYPEQINDVVFRKLKSDFSFKLNNFFLENAPEYIDVCWTLYNKGGKHWKQNASDLIWDKFYPAHELPFKIEI